jgi:type II secretory ATPase GspE/PulE/Tfp pilus assembly ATPase PilB-like protein/FixJ family two-component response regulator
MKSKLANLFLDGDDKSETGEAGPTVPYSLLMVDDEPDILESLKRVFRQESYRIFTAGNAEEALAILAKEEVQVILSDHRMPGMTGAEFLGLVKERFPATIRIMLTGYADISAVMGAINTGAVYKFITKPWNDEDLRITVSLAFEQFGIVLENHELKKQAKKRKEEIKKLARYVELNRSQLLHVLAQNGVINQEQREKAQKAHEKSRKAFPEILSDLGYAGFAQIAGVLKAKLGIETVAPKEYDPPEGLLDLFPEEFCRRNKALPLKRADQRHVLLAMCDPTDYALVEDIRFLTGFEITPALAQGKELEEAIDAFFGKPKDAAGISDLMIENPLQMAEYDPYEAIEVVLDDEDSQSVEEILKDSTTPPAIRLVNLIIWEGLKARASDIHIEKRVKHSLARFRVDGILEDRIQIPEQYHQAVVSRIKIMAEMDISERRRPQDGRITVKAQTRILDMRISTLPAISGEKVVMRLLDRNASLLNIAETGADKEDVAKLSALIRKPQGMILSTGPTGSGKTTTLYSLLQSHSSKGINYVTIEDPVEYYLEYAGQVLVKDKIGLNFASILRAILRQDPNVILLGEIRDFETAEVAFHAALTGHLVLSTIHTNSAAATVSRLLDLGVKPYVISSALEGVIAQRLLRKLCPHCIEEAAPDPEILHLLGDPGIGASYVSKGCRNCHQTGFAGRVGIFEVLVPSAEVRKLIAEGFTESELLRKARLNGMKTLLECAVNKVTLGQTSLAEVFRVLGPQELVKQVCPACARAVQEWMLFCPGCGTRVKMLCPSCGEKMENEWGFCAKCGHGLSPADPGPVRESAGPVKTSDPGSSGAGSGKREKRKPTLPENGLVEEEIQDLDEWEKKW